MVNHLPNALSGLRIVLSLCLLQVPVPGPAFCGLYLLCGISDLLDGWLARRLQAESRLGSRLDSAADFILTCVLLWRLLPVIRPGRAVLLWIAAIAFMRLSAAITARLRFGRWGFLHTLGNKAAGGLLFLYPLALGTAASRPLLYLSCAVAALSAAEEWLIELTAASWDADCRSFFHRQIRKK